MELLRSLRKFAREEAGVSAIEYALVASFIALAAITAMGTLGTTLDSAYSYISGLVKTS